MASPNANRACRSKDRDATLMARAATGGCVAVAASSTSKPGKGKGKPARAPATPQAAPRTASRGADGDRLGALDDNALHVLRPGHLTLVCMSVRKDGVASHEVTVNLPNAGWEYLARRTSELSLHTYLSWRRFISRSVRDIGAARFA